MSRIKWVTVIVFNAGGFTGNIFHEFSDGFIPSSSLSIQSSPDQDVVLMISKALDWCVNKYTEILRAVTKYFIITLIVILSLIVSLLPMRVLYRMV